jgi:hypothetical protein
MVRAADASGAMRPGKREGMLIVLVVMMGLAPTLSVAQTPAAPPPAGAAQPAAPAATREALIEREQAAKVPTLRPYTPGKVEIIFDKADAIIEGGTLRWHPFFQSAYAGGGFTLGAGRAFFVSPYNLIDVRGSYTIKGYKRIETEFIAPRLFERRARLSVLGGWREATQVGFFGVGTDSREEDKTNYLFQQPYASALFTILPTRRALMLRGGAEFTQWTQEPGEGGSPSVDELYSLATLAGLGAEVTYLHTQATVGFDWRPATGYARRGGFYGVTFHDFTDNDDQFGFRMLEYEAIQHLPIFRDTWVLSFRGRVQTSSEKDGQQTPFFMLPALGGGSTLRGFDSWRFRDEHSLLLQAEWRVMVNRYLDLALFYDAGTVAARREELDLDRLKDDFGVGIRFHGPFTTPLRVELAKSHEGLAIVFASTPSF